MTHQKRCALCHQMFTKRPNLSLPNFAKQRTCSNRCGQFLRSGWTPSSVTLLAAYWRQGLPASEIARFLNVTRNAVIGKANRLNLEHHKDAPRHTPHSSAA